MLIPMVLADMFGSDLIHKSVGLQMLAMGIADMFAVPLGGTLIIQLFKMDFSYVNPHAVDRVLS